MKGRFAGTTLGIKGKAYSPCDACGAWHATNYGAKIVLDDGTDMMFLRKGLCRKCARKLLKPIFEESKKLSEIYYREPATDELSLKCTAELQRIFEDETLTFRIDEDDI